MIKVLQSRCFNLREEEHHMNSDLDELSCSRLHFIHSSRVDDRTKNRWSRWSRISWSTVSNAADRSRSESREKFPESIARRISERISARTVSVEWNAR